MISASNGVSKVAILEGPTLVQYYSSENTGKSKVGNIYLGKVKNVLPGMEYDAFQVIKEIENVVDATLLFGDYDIIVKLEAESLGIIAKTVVNTIRQVS